MGFFKKKESSLVPTVQLRSTTHHPFGVMDTYVPMSGGDGRLYEALREAIPVIDAAIVKLIRLTGGVSAKCENSRAESELNTFLRNVNIGRGQRGINAFINQYLDSMLTYGRAVGEIVLTKSRSVAAVVCGNVSDIEIAEGDNPLDFSVCAWDGVKMSPLPNQNLILFTPYNPDTKSPYGVSLMRSMPFLADVLMKIYHSLGIDWERAGNVRYSVIYKPQNDSMDKAYATERAQSLAEEWGKAMQSSKHGSVRDFVAVGDVDIKVIGSDNRILDSEVPVRQILEQLVSRTGIPPFMLGLNWSSTERMSAQQADILTSEITAIRRGLEPVLEKICRVTRDEGAKARGTVTFYASDVSTVTRTVPVGTVCQTQNGVQFTLLDDVTVPAGSLNASGTCECTSIGVKGNAAAGTVIYMVTPPIGIARCENSSAFLGGRDRENDESLRNRVVNSYRMPINGTNDSYYEYLALNHNGVKAVKVLPRNRGLGTVDLVITSDSGIPTSALVNELQAEINTKRELCVSSVVSAATAAPQSISVAVALKEGYSLAQVTANINQTLNDHFDGSLLGKDVLVAELVNLIFNTEGVKNCSLTYPTEDLEIEPTELPTLNSVTVTELE